MDFTSDIVEPQVDRKGGSIPSSSHHSDSSELLNDDDKRLLELQDLKEQLLKERDALIKGEVELRREVNNLERERFMAGYISSESSDLYSEEEDEEESEEDENGENIGDMDSNAAKIFMDLVLLSSKRFDSPAESKTFLDGNSTLQEELSVKYDTLPLLNMNLRLRYLTKHLYKHVELHIDHDDEDGSIQIVTAKFKRNVSKPFEIEFKMEYDERHGKLTQFQIISVSPLVKLYFDRVLYATEDNNRVCLVHNPVTLLFFCHEFDRLSCETDKLIKMLKDKFDNRLRYHEETHNLESKSVIIQDMHSYDPINRELLIRFEILTDKRDSTINNHRQSMMVSPRLKIHLTLRHEGSQVKSPNVNDIFKELVQEYELETALIELISSIMFI